MAALLCRLKPLHCKLAGCVPLGGSQDPGWFQGITRGRAAASHDTRWHLSCEVSRTPELPPNIEAKFGQLYNICFPIRVLFLFAHAGYLLVLLSLAFFLASSNINSLNNFSQGIHSAKRKTNITVERELSAVWFAVDEGFALFSFHGCNHCSRLWHTAGHFSSFAFSSGKYLGLKYILKDFWLFLY